MEVVVVAAVILVVVVVGLRERGEVSENCSRLALCPASVIGEEEDSKLSISWMGCIWPDN